MNEKVGATRVERGALVERLKKALPLLDGLETGRDCEDYAFAKANGFQAMTFCPEAFEALRCIPDAINALAAALPPQATAGCDEGLLDRSVNLGDEADEPTLRSIIRAYYREHFDDVRSDELTAAYVAALEAPRSRASESPK